MKEENEKLRKENELLVAKRKEGDQNRSYIVFKLEALELKKKLISKSILDSNENLPTY